LPIDAKKRIRERLRNKEHQVALSRRAFRAFPVQNHQTPGAVHHIPLVQICVAKHQRPTARARGSLQMGKFNYLLLDEPCEGLCQKPRFRAQAIMPPVRQQAFQFGQKGRPAVFLFCWRAGRAVGGQVVQRSSHPGESFHLSGLERVPRQNASREESVEQQDTRVILAAHAAVFCGDGFGQVRAQGAVLPQPRQQGDIPVNPVCPEGGVRKLLLKNLEKVSPLRRCDFEIQGGCSPADGQKNG